MTGVRLGAVHACASRRGCAPSTARGRAGAELGVGHRRPRERAARGSPGCRSRWTARAGQRDDGRRRGRRGRRRSRPPRAARARAPHFQPTGAPADAAPGRTAFALLSDHSPENRLRHGVVGGDVRETTAACRPDSAERVACTGNGCGVAAWRRGPFRGPGPKPGAGGSGGSAGPDRTSWWTSRVRDGRRGLRRVGPVPRDGVGSRRRGRPPIGRREDGPVMPAHGARAGGVRLRRRGVGMVQPVQVRVAGARASSSGWVPAAER